MHFWRITSLALIQLFGVHLSPDVAIAPSNLHTTDVRSDSVTLEWSKPRSDGYSPITAYIIEWRETTSNYWTKAGSVDGLRTNYMITNLRPGMEYYFRVFAENDMGVSEPCTMTMPVRLPSATSSS